MSGSRFDLLRAGALASALALLLGAAPLARADDPDDPAPPPTAERFTQTSRVMVNGVDLLVRRAEDGKVHLRLTQGERVEEEVIEPEPREDGEAPAEGRRGLSVKTLPVEGEPDHVRLEVTVDGRVVWSRKVEAKGAPPPRDGEDPLGRLRKRFDFELPFGEEGFDPEKLRERLRERFGEDFDFDFRVVPFGEDGFDLEKLHERLRRLRERHSPPERDGEDEDGGEQSAPRRGGRWV